MNERIKQLKQQAGIDYNPDQEGLDLFAELIIRETFDWVVNNVGLMEDTEWQSLKKHFGVEE
jgi:hypothetical protein